MKGIILAGATSILIFIGMSALFRLYRVSALVALLVYFCVLGTFVFLFAITPNNLYFLSPAFVTNLQGLDFAVGSFALSASFFGGWLQLFNLTDRGYSLRMLVDILYQPGRSTTVDEIMSGYADGRGLRWMYDIRIDGILRTGLVSYINGTLTLTPRGQLTAGIFIFLRKVYKIGEPQT